MALSKNDLKQIAELIAASQPAPATNKASAPATKQERTKFEKTVACQLPGNCERKFATAKGATEHKCSTNPTKVTRLPEVHDPSGETTPYHVSASTVHVGTGAVDPASQPAAWLTDRKSRPVAQRTADARARELAKASEALEALGEKWGVRFDVVSTRVAGA